VEVNLPVLRSAKESIHVAPLCLDMSADASVGIKLGKTKGPLSLTPEEQRHLMFFCTERISENMHKEIVCYNLLILTRQLVCKSTEMPARACHGSDNCRSAICLIVNCPVLHSAPEAMLKGNHVQTTSESQIRTDA